MIRTMLVLRADPRKVEDVIAMYRNEDILQYSLDQSDATASEISIAADGSGDILVTALWPNAEAYQGWIDNPFREESAPRLAELLVEFEVGSGRIFEIDHSVVK